MTLFRAQGALYPESSRSHLEFRVFLDRDWPSLTVDFAYEPKLLEDPAAIAALTAEARPRFGLPDDSPDPASLQNLLTLSFDDAAGFRGAAHRHPNRQSLVLGPAPSPGLTPGAVPRGLLRIVLSAHAVVTEEVRYTLILSAPEA